MAQLQNGQLTPSTESDVDFDTGRGCYRPEQRPYDASPPVKVSKPREEGNAVLQQLNRD